MNVDRGVLDDWVATICEEQISDQRSSVYNVAALCLNDLEVRQHLLASTSADEAVHELRQHLDGWADESE